MKYILFLFLIYSTSGSAQWKDFKLTVKGDTINRLDQQDKKHGEWVVHYDNLRGEPGYEEEGVFLNNRKEGEWRLFNLMGDLIGIEHYRWGFKDGVCQYFNTNGDLRSEQSWKALNPDKPFDTIMVEDVDKLNSYHQAVVKNEGASLKHGEWKYYDAGTGTIVKSENYVLGKLEQQQTNVVAAEAEKKAIAKPKEVLEFEKKNSGKKKVKYRDGSTN